MADTLTKEQKIKALREGALKEINKQYGNGSVMFLDDQSIVKIDRIPSGSVKLDKILGGGYPVGRVIEIYGPESSGKSTMALQAVAACQQKGMVCAYIDAENATNPDYATALGVNMEELIFSQPDSGEQGLDITETLVKSGAIDLIVVDSVAALVPQAELDGEMGDASIGLQARLMSKAMRKLVGAMNQSKCTVIFINQIREKVGVMFGCLHGDVLVNFVDGRSLPIKHVVEEQIEGEVWSYNEEKKLFEPKKIIDWHYNGDVEKNTDYIHFETDAVDETKGTFAFMVTPDHEVMTDNGWKKAKDISFDDKILSKYDRKEYFVSIKSMRVATNEEMKIKGKYDITIEDNHNYMVGGIENGIIVHNSPETTTGGRALKFYASVRLDVRKKDAIKEGSEIIGHKLGIKTVKNKVAPPMKSTEVDIIYGKGVDVFGDLLDLGVELGLIAKSGSWFSFEGEKIGQGREAAKKWLSENPEAANLITEAVKNEE